MKCYVNRRLDPWSVWTIQIQNYADKIEYVTDPSEADVIIEDTQSEALYSTKPRVFYLNDEDHIEFVRWKDEDQFIVTTEFLKAALYCKGIEDRRIHIWIPPCREYTPSRLPCTGDFVLVSNGDKPRDNIAEVVKAFLEFSIGDMDSIVEGKNNLHLFSAYEPLIEPFNNIKFHGLQPNRVLMREIRSSILAISPYRGLGRPSLIQDALVAGTPPLIVDTQTNREIHHYLPDWCFYTPDNLVEKMNRIFDEGSFVNSLSYNSVTVLRSVHEAVEAFEDIVLRSFS